MTAAALNTVTGLCNDSWHRGSVAATSASASSRLCSLHTPSALLLPHQGLGGSSLDTLVAQCKGNSFLLRSHQ